MSVQVEILGPEHASAVLVPPAAVVRDGETTVVMTVGADSKAHRNEVELGVVAPDAVEIREGHQGRRQGDRARPERPARRRRRHRRIMSLAGLVDRYGRAIVARRRARSPAPASSPASALPSSIYPRLEFPRVVIIGHSGTLPARR